MDTSVVRVAFFIVKTYLTNKLSELEILKASEQY